MFNLKLTGKNLIEASAGTGKTYSIATLTLRYILEKNVSIKDILIVTFTTAATFELKDRIRKFLKMSYDYFSHGIKSELSNDFIKYLNKFKDEASKKNLRLSLYELDEASIFTIHGFCYRVLIENAFETKLDFQPEFLHNESDIIIEAIYDFWRKSILILPEYFLEYSLKRYISIEQFYKIATAYLNKNFVKIKPQCNLTKLKKKLFNIKLQRDIDTFSQLKQNLLKDWEQNKENLINFFKLNNPRIRSLKKYEKLIDNFFKSKEYTPKEDDFLKLFENTSEKLFFKELKNLVDIGNKIEKELNENIIYLKSFFLDTLLERIEKIKENKKVISYNDLILKLYYSLVLKKNKKLKNILSNRYYVAFIDEFQDTDLFQYEIFKKIFSEKDIFFIGDPKQSIYSFRGADIHTYLRAKNEVENIYTLKKSFRFYPDYLDVINFIFNKKNSFLIDEIKYSNIKSGDYKLKFLYKNKTIPPFTIKFLKKEFFNNKRGSSIELISSIIIKDMANEIINLIEKDYYIENKNGEKTKINGSHIAILVRTNREAETIKNYFLKLNIPSIIYSGISVFKTQECIDIFYTLNAVLHPSNISYIKCALLTDIFCINFNKVNSINFDESLGDFYRNMFKNYQEIFYKDGIYNMFQEIFNDFKTKLNLLSRPDGERKITNYYHIIELCNNALHTEINGIEELIKWLKEKINSETTLSEEYEIRLDTDESAVKIITVHRCKGLEFPIVFIPFFWKEIKVEEPFLYKNYFSLIDDSEERELAFKELFAEELRLFYVAITRGMAKCFLYFSSIAGRNGARAKSVYNYLFNIVSGKANDFESIESLNDEDKIKILKRIPHSKVITEFNLKERNLKQQVTVDKNELIFKEKTKELKPSYIITSFTSLINEKFEQIDEFDFTMQESLYEEISESKIFDFPSGFKTGIFYHSLLEQLDFTISDDLIKQALKQKLIEYGFNLEEWFDVIFKNLCHILNKPLVDNIKLKDIPYEQTLREVQFYFFEKKDDILKCIENIFKVDEEFEFVKKLKDIKNIKIDAFFNGFIDLVFEKNGKYYIVDYKTNNLGKKYEYYTIPNLKNEIIKEYYFLQIGIYLIALVKFLKSKGIKDIFDKIGGIIYLFVRGVKKDNCGIYFYKPSKKALDFIN